MKRTRTMLIATAAVLVGALGLFANKRSTSPVAADDPAVLAAAKAELRQLPQFADLPEPVFDQMMQTVAQALATGEVLSDATRHGNAFLARHFQDSLPITTNHAAFQHGEATLVAALELQAHSRESCYRYFYPTSDRPAPLDLLSDQATAANALATSAVIAGADPPHQTPSLDEVEVDRQLVIYQLEQRYGSDVALLVQSDLSDVQRERLCDITISLYQAVVALQVETGGQLIRWIATGG